MRSFVLLLALSVPAYAEEDRPEKIEVTASKIVAPFGPVSWDTSPLEHGPPCAEPTCGGAIEPVEPGTGKVLKTSEEKGKQNKDNKEKAKGALGTLGEVIKSGNQLLTAFKKWFNGEVNFSHSDWYKKYSGGQVIEEGGSCLEGQLKLGTGGDPRPSCVEVHGSTTPIKKPDGKVENQLKLQYVIKYECYFRGECREEVVTFIAGTEGELKVLLNGALGETYF